MDFQQKYNKYKQKYLELKKMKAGLRLIPAGPMIGYPTVPIMPPQVRVTGPIPQPAVISPVMSPVFPIRSVSPVRSISPFAPNPFLPIPFPLIRPYRVIRFTSSDDYKPTPTTYRIYLSINDAAQLKKINDTITWYNNQSPKKSETSLFSNIQLLNTIDKGDYDGILNKLKGVTSINFDKVEVKDNIIRLLFKNPTIDAALPSPVEISIPLFNANNNADAMTVLGGAPPLTLTNPINIKIE